MSKDFFDQKLSALKCELKANGEEIIQYIVSMYGTSTSEVRLDLKNDPFKMLAVLQHDTSEIIKESQERHEYNILHAADLTECARLAKLLNNVSLLNDRIYECEAMIFKASLLPSCDLIDQIGQLLSELPSTNSELGGGKIFSILKKENKLLQCSLVGKLGRILRECCQFDYGRLSVNRALKGMLRSEDTFLKDAVLLKDVWVAMARIKRTEYGVDELLKNIWVFLIRPLWCEEKAHVLPPRISKMDANGTSELIIENLSALENGTAEYNQKGNQVQRSNLELGMCRMPITQLIDNINKIFSFIWTELLCANEEAAATMAKKLSSPPFSLLTMIIDSVSSQLPSCEADLGSYRRSLEEPCRHLENTLRTSGFSSMLSTAEKTTTNTTMTSSYKKGNSSSSTQPTAVATNTTATIPPVLLLSNYIADLPCIYADIRRREILKNARDVLLSDYHNTMIAAGDAAEDQLSSAGDIGDPLAAALGQSVSFAIQTLKFDACQVSLAACRLLKLVHEVMKQACDARSVQVAHTLTHSARDCLEMFMAIVPVQFNDVISTVPRMGAVFYNDCLYIAHNCTLITHKYRAELGKRVDELLEHTVGFADFIPRLRTLGDQCLVRHLREQRTALSALVKHIQLNPESYSTGCDDNNNGSSNTSSGIELRPGGLLKGGLQLAGKIGTKIGLVGAGGSSSSDTNKGNSNSNNNFASQQQQNDDDAAVLVRRHLERLSSQWIGVMQEPVYARVMGHLLEVGVLKLIMQPVLTAECIAETAGIEICRVYRSIQRVRSIFRSSSKDGDEEGQEEDECIQRVCSSWRKFLALTDLLEYSLGDLAEWLPRKKFATFTGSEMTSLTKALFEDSPRRKGILDSILEMSS